MFYLFIFLKEAIINDLFSRQQSQFSTLLLPFLFVWIQVVLFACKKIYYFVHLSNNGMEVCELAILLIESVLMIFRVLSFRLLLLVITNANF